MSNHETPNDIKLPVSGAEYIDAEPKGWLWENYVPERSVVLVKGQRGQSKTTFLLKVASIAHEAECTATNEIASIYLGNDEGAEFKNSLRCLGLFMGFVLTDSNFKPGKKGIDDFEEIISYACDKFDVNTVIIENISDWLPSDFDKENEVEVLGIIKELNRLADTHCVTFLLGIDEDNSWWEELIRRQFHLFPPREGEGGDVLVVGVGSDIRHACGGPPFMVRLSDALVSPTGLSPTELCGLIQHRSPGYEAARKLDIY